MSGIMINLIGLLVIISISTPIAGANPTVGVSHAKESLEGGRIIGGKEAIPHSYPSILSMYDGGSKACSATIISEEWVLTAAHCVLGDPDPESYSFIAGDHSLNVTEESEQSVRGVQRFRHDGFTYHGKLDDIAVLKVSPPIKFNDKVQPMTLPPKGYQVKGVTIVAGWGKQGEGKPHNPSLMEVDVPVATNEKCAEQYGVTGQNITAGHICAGYEEGGKSSCQDDSGGPLYEVGDDGKQIQVGIVSFQAGCALPKWYGVYTRVSEYLDWIRSKMEAAPPAPVTGRVQMETVIARVASRVAKSLCSQKEAYDQSKIVTPPVKRNPSAEQACFLYELQRCDVGSCKSFHHKACV